MHDGRHRNTYRIGAALQIFKVLQNRRIKLRSNRGGALRVLIVDANEVHTFKFAVHARVIAPKFADTYDGYTDLLCFCRRVHSLLIPLVTPFGSPTTAGGNARIAIHGT